jgi:predicted amidohydrolase
MNVVESLPNMFHFSDLLSSTMRVALVQMRAGADKTANVAGACARIADAAKNGANLVVLPVSVQCAGAYADQQEFFNAPYGLDFFAPYAERIPSGATVTSLAECAAKNKVWLVGGSIPERSDDDKLYNTMTVYDPTGAMVATHRKVH